MRIRHALAAVTGALVLLLTAHPVHASLIILEGNISGDVENILFNEAGLIGSGMTVTGITSETDILFTFGEDSEIVSTPSAGQARVEGTGADPLFDSLLISGLDPLLAFLLFEANVNVEGTPTLRITATGSDVVTYDFLAGPGENRFAVYALLDDYLSSIRIQSLDADAIQDVRQVRVGGLSFEGGLPEPLLSTPEPGALVLLGTGLLAVSWTVRRRLV